MNCIACLNLNDFMPACARQSFKAAAKRWDVEYIEITTALGPMHPFWQKAILPQSKHVTGMDRIIQLDCDILIRSDCPSPFNLVPRENFGVVSRIQPGRQRQITTNDDRYRLTAALYGLHPYAKPEEHLNAGFILYNVTTHKDILRKWQEAGAYSNWRDHGMPEQTALSCLLSECPNIVTWLPWQFNACSVPYRSRRLPPGPMRAYIYHLHRPRPGGLAATIARYQWRV